MSSIAAAAPVAVPFAPAPAPALLAAPARRFLATNGRSSGDGAYATIASSSGCTPMFCSAEVQKSGNRRPDITPRLRPIIISSAESVPSSKNRSISASSASAIISMSASRSAVALSRRAAGISPAVIVPVPSAANVSAR